MFSGHTNWKQIHPVLHALQVYCFLFLSIFIALQLSPYLLSDHTTYVPLKPSNRAFYQPIPHSSVCQCIDSVPMLFFLKPHYASLSLCSRRHKILFSLLLLLSGDVSLNPGPRVASPRPANNLNIFCQNIRSATVINSSLNKPEMIKQHIQDSKMDFLFLTETWLSPDCPPSIPNSLTPSNYSFLQVSRPSGRGGGIAAIFKSKYSVSSINKTTFSSFEHMLLRLTCGIKSYHFLIVYRPPSSSKPLFLSDFALLLEDLASSPSEFVAMGDFNLHLDDPDDSYSTSFKTLLETFDLKQHISSSTHTSGHILDLLITKTTSSISSSGLTDFFLSDHKAVTCQYHLLSPPLLRVLRKQLEKYPQLTLVTFHLAFVHLCSLPNLNPLFLAFVSNLSQL